MKKLSKLVTSAAAAAVLSVSLAAPASAQQHRSDRGGISAGDVIAGVAIIGGVAAIAAALDRDGDRDGSRDGYGYSDRYRNDYQIAVRACGREADRYGRGRVQITDVDRKGNYSYRVRGVIDGGGYDRRNDRGYNYDRGYDRNYGYDRDDRYRRAAFTCTALADGRITRFRTNNG